MKSLLICTLFTFPIFAKNVLIIGDSLSVPAKIGLGRVLGDKLEAQGHQIVSAAYCGASPFWYYGKAKVGTNCNYYFKNSKGIIDQGKSGKAPHLDEMISKESIPDTIVIQQGTNMYSAILEGRKNGIKLQVKELLKGLEKQAPNAKCIWVGPPEIAKYGKAEITDKMQNEMYKLLKEALQEASLKCDFVNSRFPTTAKPDGDGTHFSKPAQTEAWINKVFDKSLQVIERSKDGIINCDDCINY